MYVHVCTYVCEPVYLYVDWLLAVWRHVVFVVLLSNEVGSTD